MATRAIAAVILILFSALIFSEPGKAALTEFPIPTPASGATEIAIDSDGNVWFTETAANKIGRISPSGTVKEFEVPTALSDPVGIAIGPDDAVWFTEYRGNQIGRISVDGQLQEFPIPTSGGSAGAIAITKGVRSGVGPGLWFAVIATDLVGFISMSKSISEVTFIHDSCGGGLLSAFSAPRGGAWFLVGNNSQWVWSIDSDGKVDQQWVEPSTGSEPRDVSYNEYVKMWRICEMYYPSGGPRAPNFADYWAHGVPNLVLASDGSVWLSGVTPASIRRLTFVDWANVYKIPSGHSATQFTPSTHGGVFFTEYDGDRIGYVNVRHPVQEYALARGSGPTGIIEARDGSLWVIEQGANKIARITSSISSHE